MGHQSSGPSAPTPSQTGIVPLVLVQALSTDSAPGVELCHLVTSSLTECDSPQPYSLKAEQSQISPVLLFPHPTGWQQPSSTQILCMSCRQELDQHHKNPVVRTIPLLCFVPSGQGFLLWKHSLWNQGNQRILENKGCQLCWWPSWGWGNPI